MDCLQGQGFGVDRQRGRRAGKTVEPGVKHNSIIDDAIADPDRLRTVPLQRLGADTAVFGGLA